MNLENNDDIKMASIKKDETTLDLLTLTVYSVIKGCTAPKVRTGITFNFPITHFKATGGVVLS
jgi:hypothetical protein